MAQFGVVFPTFQNEQILIAVIHWRGNSDGKKSRFTPGRKGSGPQRQQCRSVGRPSRGRFWPRSVCPTLKSPRHSRETRPRRGSRDLARRPDGVARDLALCSAKGCGRDACNDACHFAAGRRRRPLIPHGHRMLIQHDGPLHLVTVVHPNWQSPVGGLVGSRGTRGPREWVKRRLNRLPNANNVIAVGQFESGRSTSSSMAR